MTICDKLNTVGTTLQENLNDRGVACTYGVGTGKSTLLDMANLINENNLLGIGDNVISITASRPYLLEDETTDLMVSLRNGIGQPLPNKTITVTDGTNTYTGSTDNQGLFKIYNIEVETNTTFTATYSNVSDTVKVEYCTFVDYAVTTNKNTNYSIGSALTVSTTDSYTSVSSTSSNSTTGRYKSNTAITGDFELIADVKLNQAYTSTGLYFGTYGNDYTIFRIKTQDWVTVKIKRENSVYSVKTSTDGGQTWTDATFQQNNNTSSSVYLVLYVYNGSGATHGLSYRNLRTKTL